MIELKKFKFDDNVVDPINPENSLVALQKLVNAGWEIKTSFTGRYSSQHTIILQRIVDE
jgi:hypothetical protein